MEDIICSGFTFVRDFDSANLAKVELVPYDVSAIIATANHGNSKSAYFEIPDYEFNLWTKPDCAGTEFQNTNRTWFYFGMRTNVGSVLVKLNIVDINKQTKMYSQGMCPVFKVLPSKNGWERIREKPTYSTDEEIFTLSFKYRTSENPQSMTYFAFTYPFSYEEHQSMLSTIDERFLNVPVTHSDDIYYVREHLCESFDKRRIDLLTVTSHRGMCNLREERLKNLFPDESVARPFTFPGKKVIFVSARVHPGETPSSFVFNGLLHLLLNREDPVAIVLRKLYVFKMIPFLNPDGVARGHYRTDSRGVNLNRVYLNPSLTEHPSVYAARSLVRYYHYGCEKPDVIPLCSKCTDAQTDSSMTDEEAPPGNTISTQVSTMSLEEKNDKNDSSSWCLKWRNLCTNCGSPLYNGSSSDSVKAQDESTSPVSDSGDVTESGVFMYMDLHGHASKKGIFIYGNHYESPEQNVECMLLPKLMSINNHNFHFTACNFSERNMFIKDKRDGMSRAGSGRVAISTITGLVKSYTLECNYNTGRILNVIPPTIRERQSKGSLLPVPPKYTPSIFEEVGRALGASILDLTGQNPLTRLPHSEFHSLSGVEEWLKNNCIDGNISPTSKVKLKYTTNLHNQGRVRSGPMLRKSSSSKIKGKAYLKLRPPTCSTERKEIMACENPTSKRPSTSLKITRSKSALRISRGLGRKSKSKMDLCLKSKHCSDKQKIVRNKQRNVNLSQKLRLNMSSSRISLDKAEADDTTKSKSQVEFRNIGLDPDMPTLKFSHSRRDLLLEWNIPNAGESSKQNRSSSVQSAGSSSSTKRETFSLNRNKTSHFSKNRKINLRRLGSNSECLGKVEKCKMKKKFIQKL